MAWFYRTKQASRVFHEVGRRCGGRPKILDENFEAFTTAASAARTRRGWRRGCLRCRPNAEALLHCGDCDNTMRVPSVEAHRTRCPRCGGRLAVSWWLG